MEKLMALRKAARQSPLTPQTRRDAAILYGILHKLGIDEVQALLKRFDMPVLGK